MSNEKQIISGLDGFRALVGKTIGPSRPVEVTQERIESFCRAVDNDEWIHFDAERCKEAGFGATIAPGMLTQAFFSKLWFDMVDIRDVPKMLFLGSDKVRLLAPLKCGQSFTMSVTVQRVEEKENGIAVYLDVTWNVVGQEKPVTVATFIIRYMDK
ncbi:MAG: MaoC/PaaZ C-terminal domain-containing protein [Noviherbaspirillum sp.]